MRNKFGDIFLHIRIIKRSCMGVELFDPINTVKTLIFDSKTNTFTLLILI